MCSTPIEEAMIINCDALCDDPMTDLLFFNYYTSYRASKSSSTHSILALRACSYVSAELNLPFTKMTNVEQLSSN